MAEENKVEEETAAEAPIDASQDEAECCVGPCDVWPPVQGAACGGGKIWRRIAGRWVCS